MEITWNAPKGGRLPASKSRANNKTISSICIKWSSYLREPCVMQELSTEFDYRILVSRHTHRQGPRSDKFWNFSLFHKSMQNL